MKQYKCLNPECNHEWSSDNDPFECPNCKQFIFEEVKPPFKPKILIGLLILLLLVFISTRSCKDNVNVTTTEDHNYNSLTIKIEGKQKEEFKIIIKNIENDSEQYESYGSNYKISDLIGTYKLIISFQGEGKVPEINSYQEIYTFEKPDNPVKPIILEIIQSPNRLTKKIKKYSLIVLTDSVHLSINQTEYSIDNQTWQVSNKFKDIDAGSYIVYARNIKNPDLVDSMEAVLAPYEKMTPPTINHLNNLISKLKDEDKARDEFRNLLGNSTIVIGEQNIKDVQQLITDVNNGYNYQIVSYDYNEDEEEFRSITVKKTP